MSDKVLYELNGHVATITYNRPEALNAIDQLTLCPPGPIST